MAETKTINIVQETCIKCGIPFWIEERHQYHLKQSHNIFYCPNGHIQYYPGKTEAERLQDKLQQAARDREYLEADVKRLRLLADANERSKNAYKGQVTRLKKRASAGVCPCCNRHFTALERHMASKHPEYGKDGE